LKKNLIVFEERTLLTARLGRFFLKKNEIGLNGKIFGLFFLKSVF